MSVLPEVRAVDPFDLPEWLGTGDVTWAAEGGPDGATGHHLGGSLESADGSLPCDLLAADPAYPAPIVDEGTRRSTHQAWHHGQVLLVEIGGRLTLTTPGIDLSADRVLVCVGRLARAVGADPARFAVVLRTAGSSEV